MRNAFLLTLALTVLASLSHGVNNAEMLPGWRTVAINDGNRHEIRRLDRSSRFVYAVAEIPKQGPQYFLLKYRAALPVRTEDGSNFAPDMDCRAVVNGRIVAPSWYARTSSPNLPKGRVFVLEADIAIPLTINGQPVEIGDWRIEDSFGVNCACLCLLNEKEQKKRLLRIDGAKAVELPLPAGVSYFRVDFRTREIVIAAANSVWRYVNDKPVEILHEDGDTLSLPQNGVARLFNGYLVIPNESVVIPTGQVSSLYRLVNGRAVPVEPPEGSRFINVFPIGKATFAMTDEKERGPSTLYELAEGTLQELSTIRTLNLRFIPPEDLGGYGIIYGENGRNQFTLFRISEKALRQLKYLALPKFGYFLDVAGARGLALVSVGQGMLGVVRSSGHVEIARTTSGAVIKARMIELAACAEGFYVLCTGTKDGDSRTMLYYRRDP